MKKLIYYSKYFNVLYYLIIFLTIKYVESDEVICQECKTILIKEAIIYINPATSDLNIYCYNTSNNSNCTKQNRYQSLSIEKGILKINDNDFIIYGFNRINYILYFYYERFHFDDSNGIQNRNGDNFNMNIFSITQLDVRPIDNSEKIVISGIVTESIDGDKKFKIFLIDLNTNQLSYRFILQTSKLNSLTSSKTMKNIQCDSLEGNNFLCALSYDDNSLFYIYGYFNGEKIEIVDYICTSDCYNGNVETIGNDKYLLCYQKDKFSMISIWSLYCQYFIINSNTKDFKVGNSYQISTFQSKTDNSPLILYKFDYSIFIKFDSKIENDEFTHVIITSFDFEINSEFEILKSDKSFTTKNFLNDKNYFYFLYTQSDDTTNTKLKKQKFIECQSGRGNITLSDKNYTYLYNFAERHENLDLKFSLNENINLIPVRNYYDTKTNSDKNFSFIKQDKSGVFDNYYFYSNSSHFSLICPLNITTCFSNCDNCVFGKEGNSSNNYCTKCRDNYFYLKDEYDKNPNYFNCYEKNEIIMHYYKGDNNQFLLCDKSCKYCINNHSCTVCNDGYYFIYENSQLKKDTTCFNTHLDNYYLNTSENIVNYYKGYTETITTVYKGCYPNCRICTGEGNEINNNCLDCNSPFKAYEFNKHQCLKNYTYECYDPSNHKKKYWEFKDNKIECLNDCKDSIILYGENKAQCVKNCTDFVNPNFKNTMFYTLLDCKGKNYCVPIDICKNGNFNVSDKDKTCIRKKECNVDVFSDEDPFIHDGDTTIITYIETTTQFLTTEIPTTLPETERLTELMTTEIETTEFTTELMTERPYTREDKEKDIAERKVIIKISNEKTNYSSFLQLNQTLVDEYLDLLNKEYEKSKKIYLILSMKYANCIITIYPLDIESYVYENLIFRGDLGFVNFTYLFPEFIDDEIDNEQILLVILIESISINSSINELNYYFYYLNEKNQEKNIILNISETNLIKNDSNLTKVIYPLKNYYNENSTLTKRNTEYLIQNIKNFYSIEPKMQLYNLSDPFFNDICVHFTSDFNTDMTLNDRRNEYYVNKSLCENNCYLEKLIINENVKSVCMCEFKNEFTFNKNAGKKDEIPSISALNAKSFLCAKETFDSHSIAKNAIFWILIILIIFLFIMLLIYMLFGNNVLKKILKLEEENDFIKKIQLNSEIDKLRGNNKEQNNIFSKKRKIKNNTDNKYITHNQESLHSSKSNIYNERNIDINNHKISKSSLIFDNNSAKKISLNEEGSNPIELNLSKNKRTIYSSKKVVDKEYFKNKINKLENDSSNF